MNGVHQLIESIDSNFGGDDRMTFYWDMSDVLTAEQGCITKILVSMEISPVNGIFQRGKNTVSGQKLVMSC